jgi:hypothetical protein
MVCSFRRKVRFSTERARGGRCLPGGGHDERECRCCGHAIGCAGRQWPTCKSGSRVHAEAAGQGNDRNGRAEDRLGRAFCVCAGFRDRTAVSQRPGVRNQRPGSGVVRTRSATGDRTGCVPGQFEAGKREGHRGSRVRTGLRARESQARIVRSAIERRILAPRDPHKRKFSGFRPHRTDCRATSGTDADFCARSTGAAGGSERGARDDHSDARWTLDLLRTRPRAEHRIPAERHRPA